MISLLAANGAADPVRWQRFAPPLSDWLVAIAIVTLVIWIALTVVCIIVERRAIRRSIANLDFPRLQLSLKYFSLFLFGCIGRTERRRHRAA